MPNGSRPFFVGSFSVEAFVADRPWERLETLLNGPGGSFGLSGPRGAGKTWLMHRALAWAKERGGVGVWFPSPSEFEPTAFLAAISDVTAIGVEEWHDSLTRREQRQALRRALPGVLSALVLMLTGGYLSYLATSSPYVNPSDLFQLLPLLGAFLGVAGGTTVLLRTIVRLGADRAPLGKVRQRASALRLEVRYAINRSDSLEGSLGAPGILGSLLKASRQRQMVEKPATLSSLIHNFRTFVRALAVAVNADQRVEKSGRAPVVIAIDELDKMASPADVAGLLRSVKAILDVPGVHFLVSISDEAARSLELGAIRVRNEFNSSFYTVINVAPLSPALCEEQLRRRYASVDRDAARVLGVLVGGIPREVSRVAELVYSQETNGLSVSAVIRTILRAEATALWQELIGRAPADFEDADVVIFQRALLDFATNPMAAAFSLARAWEPPWSSSGEWAPYTEQWRRLIVRREAARLLVDRRVLDNPVRSQVLQNVINTAALSAVAAREILIEAVESWSEPRSHGGDRQMR